MKTLQKITLIIAFAGLFASCQSGTDVNKILSKPETRKRRPALHQGHLLT